MAQRAASAPAPACGPWGGPLAVRGVSATVCRMGDTHPRRGSLSATAAGGGGARLPDFSLCRFLQWGSASDERN